MIRLLSFSVALRDRAREFPLIGQCGCLSSQARHEVVQLPQRRGDEGILLTTMQIRGHAHSLRLPFRLIHSPHNRLCGSAVLSYRAVLREDDEVALALRFIWYGQAEELGYILSSQRILHGAGCWVQQADLLLREVQGAGDELEAQFLSRWGGEGDVFAVEPDVGFSMEVEAVDCCAVVVGFESALLGGLGGWWWKRRRRRLRGCEGHDVGAYLC